MTKRPLNFKVVEMDSEWHVYDCVTGKLIAKCATHTYARLVENALEFEHNPRAYGYEMVNDWED